MKMLSMVLLIIAATFHIANGTNRTCVQGRETHRAESTLQVKILPSKRRYKLNEQFQMLVMLMNVGKKNMYILGTLEWGHSASFLFHILDSSGREIKPRAFPDDQTFVPREDNNAFVKLLPSHFLGTDFYAPLNLLSLDKPGKYSVYVEYHSPISSAATQLSPYWGSEKPPIRSNVASFEVIR